MNNYTWANADHTMIRFVAENGESNLIPTDPANCDYQHFLESEIEPGAFVAPPKPAEPTLEEKLSSLGIDIDQLKEALN